MPCLPRYNVLAWFIPCVAFLFSMPAPAHAETLDRDKIHNNYNNGEFDLVEKDLEGFKTRNKTYTHEDSVFIAKHLAVVYAANPQTREKGRYYMFRLLELLPTAKILDMFVSEEIDRIFDKVKEEFLAKQSALGKTPVVAAEPDASKPGTAGGGKLPKAPSGSDGAHGSGALYWVAGSVGLAAAAGAAVYFLMPQEQQPKDKIYVVDASDK